MGHTELRYEKAHRRNDPEWAAYSYSQPFPGLASENFTNFSGSVHADEAALRALLDAGGQIAERLTSDKTAYAKELQPPHAVGVPSIRRGSKWEKFKLAPPPRPAEFEPFVSRAKQSQTAPSKDQQRAAVHRVFQLFLQRKPTNDEAKRYGGLLQRSIEKSGSLAALRGLITAVMVCPEFVFRMEVGMGEEDEHGRRMLSPNELVYAIAYALTNDGPDAVLWESANSGRLKTKSDIERNTLLQSNVSPVCDTCQIARASLRITPMMPLSCRAFDRVSASTKGQAMLLPMAISSARMAAFCHRAYWARRRKSRRSRWWLWC